MLWGRFASRAGEARFPTLWDGRVFGCCPSIQGPSLSVYDTAGYGLHTKKVNGGSAYTRHNGQYAVDFDGTLNNYLAVPKDIGATTLISFSAWILFRASTRQSFASSGPDMTLPRCLLGITGSQNIDCYRGGYVSSTGTVPLNKLIHIAVTNNNVTTMFYFNGSLDSSLPQGMSHSQQTQFHIGTGLNGRLNGLMDDVNIYNRVLSAGEIRTLARRRGISYELRRDVVEGGGGFQSAWARQRAGIIGGGVR